MNVSEVIQATGITPSGTYKGIEMADDFILAIQTESTQTKETDYIVCQDHVKGHPASLNPATKDANYVRTGKATSKTGNQRSFAVEGDRCMGDDFQDFVLSNQIKYGTGSDVEVPYVWFSIRTGKGEKGVVTIIVNDDAGGNPGDNASFKLDLKATGTPTEYTYSAGV